MGSACNSAVDGYAVRYTFFLFLMVQVGDGRDGHRPALAESNHHVVQIIFLQPGQPLTDHVERPLPSTVLLRWRGLKLRRRRRRRQGLWRRLRRVLHGRRWSLAHPPLPLDRFLVPALRRPQHRQDLHGDLLLVAGPGDVEEPFASVLPPLHFGSVAMKDDWDGFRRRCVCGSHFQHVGAEIDVEGVLGDPVAAGNALLQLQDRPRC